MCLNGFPGLMHRLVLLMLIETKESYIGTLCIHMCAIVHLLCNVHDMTWAGVKKCPIGWGRALCSDDDVILSNVS